MCARDEQYGFPADRYFDAGRNVRLRRWRRCLVNKMPYNWKCTVCGVTAGTISSTYPPTCNNPEKHSTKVVEMELITTGKKDKVE
jgi:hypothetical protein